MKTKIWGILITAAILVSAGCGGVDTNSANQGTSNSNSNESEQSSDSNQNGNTEKSSESTGNSEITLEDVMNAPESSAEDFSGGDNGEGGYEISGYNGEAEIVVIPDEIDGLPVVSIATLAFANDRASTVHAVKLSDSVVTIGKGSFGNNESLEIFICGSGLESIGEDAFLYCTSLATVVLNDELKEIGKSAFMNCSALSELTISSTIEEMGTACIYGVSDDFVLYGTAGSVAESYAEEYGYTFMEN